MKLFGRRRNTLLTLLIRAIVFLVIGLVASAAQSSGYDVIISGKLVLGVASYFFFLASIVTVLVMLIVLVLKKRKPVCLIFIIPVLLVLLVTAILFLVEFGFFCGDAPQRYTFEEFDHDIVIENRSILLVGRSTVYEVRGIIAKRVASVTGDDCWCPLEKDECFSITVQGDQLVFDYFFVGPEIGARQLVLEYLNRHFIAKPEIVIPQT